MNREMWPGEKTQSGMNYDNTFSVSPLFLFSLQTRVYTHSLTHTHIYTNNNNSKESVNSRLSLLKSHTSSWLIASSSADKGVCSDDSAKSNFLKFFLHLQEDNLSF